MHAMTHRSHFFGSSFRVSNEEPTVCFTVSLASAVFRVKLLRLLIPTAMSHSQSLNTSLLEVMISCKNIHVFVRDLSDLTLQMVFDAWWASMNVGLQQPITWRNSRHAPSWHCYLHR